jgi:Family of unknown function (DUF6262)
MAAADNRAHLAAATQRRSTAARDRARAALRRLDREGRPVTFTAVANAAHVSRALLYRDPDLHHEIERLRDAGHPKPPRLPAAQRATEASLNRRVEALLDDVRFLRAENHKLRDHLAVLLGEHRAANSTPRANANTTGSRS